MANYLTDEEFMSGGSTGGSSAYMDDDEFLGRKKKDKIESHKPPPSESMKVYEDWVRNFRQMKGVSPLDGPDREGLGPHGGAAAIGLAPAKGLSMLTDLASMPARYAVANKDNPEEGHAFFKFLANSPLFKGKADAPTLTSKVQDLQNMIAGKDISKDTNAQLLEAGTQAVAFPGSQAKNVITALTSRGTDIAAEDAGLPMWARLPMSVMAGYGAGGVYDLAKAGRMPNTLDPRLAAANRRVKDAFSQIPEDELVAGARTQADFSPSWMTPSQALDRRYPALDALESELRGSSARNARNFQTRLANQPGQVEAQMSRVAYETSPYNTLPTSADQFKTAAQRAIGEIERTPNVITGSLYDSARSAPNLVPAPRINGVIEDILATQQANLGNKQLTSQLNSFVKQLTTARNTVRTELQKQSGRQMMLDETPMPSDVVKRVSDSFKATLDDFSVKNPSQSNLVSQILKRQTQRLTGEALDVQDDLARATAAQRGLRPDYKVSEFDYLSQAAKGGNEPVKYIAKILGNENVNPKDFRTFADRIHQQDPNAFRDAAGNYIAAERNRALKLVGGNANSQAGINFTGALVGTPNKKEAFRITLEKAFEGRQGVENPKDAAEGVMRLLELTRRISKQVGTDVGRAEATEISARDVARQAGHVLMARSGQVNMIKAVLNKFSDDQIASMFNDANSIRLLTAAGAAPIGEPANKALLAFLAASGLEE